MYRKVLVDAEIRSGERLLKQLELANTPVTAAFWLYADDANEWRLVIVSPSVGEIGPRQLYALLGVVLMNPAGPPIPIPLERIFLVSPHDLRYKQVRLAALGAEAGFLVAAGPARNVSGEDAYIYRMA
jgi:hypothetical protein